MIKQNNVLFQHLMDRDQYRDADALLQRELKHGRFVDWMIFSGIVILAVGVVFIFFVIACHYDKI